MYVCPQMTNIYSSTCLGFRIHFSMRQPCFNKHSFNHTHSFSVKHTHALARYSAHAYTCVELKHTHTQEAKKNMHTYTKYRWQACKKRCSQTALSFSRSMTDAELCMQTKTKMQVYTETLKHQQTLIPDNIPGH